MNATADMLQLVWPLSFVLCFIFILRKVEGDVRPIVTNMVNGLAAGAQRNATQWAIALAFGVSASLSAFYDVFNDLAARDLAALSWHQYAALWSKVLNPFIIATLAYVTQSNFKPATGGGGGGQTTQPFSTVPPSPLS